MSKLKDTTQKEAVKDILSRGETSEFWQIILESINDSIEYFRKELDSDNLKDLPAEQYKVESEILKVKIKFLKELRDKPKDLASWVENPDDEHPNLDPYDTYKPETDDSGKQE